MENEYVIERRGGFAGLPAAQTVTAQALDPADRATLDELIDRNEQLARDPGADRYTYVVTRHAADGARTTREIPESLMPPAVANLVTEQI